MIGPAWVVSYCEISSELTESSRLQQALFWPIQSSEVLHVLCYFLKGCCEIRLDPKYLEMMQFGFKFQPLLFSCASSKLLKYCSLLGIISLIPSSPCIGWLLWYCTQKLGKDVA